MCRRRRRPTTPGAGHGADQHDRLADAAEALTTLESRTRSGELAVFCATRLRYERRPGIFAEQQMRALGQRMELGWLLDLQLATLADRRRVGPPG